MANKIWSTVLAEINRSCVIEKLANFLSADKSQPTKNIFKHV